MSGRHISLRTVVVAWILGVALGMLPLAYAFAGSGGTTFPH
jgi:hypothetical protein